MNYIEKIVELIIRPSRDHYHTKRLGDPQILIQTQNDRIIKAFRQDRIILNKHNQHLHLSFYSILSVQKPQLHFYTDRNHSFSNSFMSPQFAQFNTNPQQFVSKSQSNIQSKEYYQTKVLNFKNKCVIYLHANNGSRMQGMVYLTKLLEAHCNVCLFDCSGSGVSDGDYVTLGLKEARDLDCVVNFLVKEKKIQHISLWGRSMGSATALIYGSRHAQDKLSSIVLDSPFKDLQKLIKQIASDKTGLPKLFFQPLLPFVRNQIQRKTGYSIGELKLKKYLQSSEDIKKQNQQTSIGASQNSRQLSIKEIRPLQKVPVMFVISKKDKFVKCHHGQKLYKRYPCADKELHYINIQHHESREQHTIQKIVDFIVAKFNTKDQSQSMLLKNSFQNDQKKHFDQQKTFSNNVNLMKYDWNQCDQGVEYHSTQTKDNFDNSENTSRTILNSERKSVPLKYNTYQSYVTPNTAHQRFSTKVIQANEFASSLSSLNKESPQYISESNTSNFNKNSQFSSNLSTNPQNFSFSETNTLAKFKSQYFQFTDTQSPYQYNQVQQPNLIYETKYEQQFQRVLSYQNSYQSLTKKRNNEDQFKYGNQSFKHFSLEKNNFQQGKIDEVVKVIDKHSQSDMGHKLVSKTYKSCKTKQKISLSSTLAFQQNLKHSSVNHQLNNSNFFSNNDNPIALKSDRYQALPNTNNFAYQFPTNNYTPILAQKQDPHRISQSPILSKLKDTRINMKLQDSPQLSKLNWNSFSQTNIKIENEKSMFTKKQKSGPINFTRASFQRVQPLFLSLIDTKSDGYSQQLKQSNNIKSLGDRKVQSTFTSRIFSDIKTNINRFSNEQVDLNRSSVFSLGKTKGVNNEQWSFGKF